jgi:ADP-dependent NAD(P)H-hydrate dehydratase / NAD(P)H-hydrate epimerase
MMKLVTVAEMRAIEQEADANGLTYAQMMENAGIGLAKIVLELVYDDEELPVVVGLVGPGNNGGDTLVALTHLAAQDWHVRAYLVNRPVENDPLVDRLKQAGGEVTQAHQDKSYEMLSAFISSATVVIDGILGTGFKLPLKSEISEVLRAANAAINDLDWPPYIVAVDCPSGVNCDTGDVAQDAIPASMTITMAAVKQGLIKFPAFDLVGELRVVDIGLTDEIKSWVAVQHEVADDEMLQEILPERPDDSHKGTYGTAMIVAGSINYTGAAMLAGKAAYRVGVGLVRMAVPGPLHSVLAGHFPEATWVLLPHEMGVISTEAGDVLLKNLDRVTGLLLGPGLGTEDTTRNFIENFIKGKQALKKSGVRIGFVHEDNVKEVGISNMLPPLVVDADGLRFLKGIEGWEKVLPGLSILTPHPGEMSELTGLSVEEIQSDRLGIALKYSQLWGQIVVLKGAFTVVSDPDGHVTVIPVATSALARAGTGDVLAGIIVGLLAQGIEPYDAAVAGAWIHAQAGLFAADRVGTPASVVAGDVVDSIGDVLMGLI